MSLPTFRGIFKTLLETLAECFLFLNWWSNSLYTRLVITLKLKTVSIWNHKVAFYFLGFTKFGTSRDFGRLYFWKENINILNRAWLPLFWSYVPTFKKKWFSSMGKRWHKLFCQWNGTELYVFLKRYSTFVSKPMPRNVSQVDLVLQLDIFRIQRLI